MLTRAGGYPNLSGVDIGAIPKLYSPRVVQSFHEQSVMVHVTDTDAEGLEGIQEQGDQVTFRKRGTISVFDYEVGHLADPEVPQTSAIKLNVDKAKAYNFLINAVDEKQSDIVLSDEHVDEAGATMAEEIDEDYFGTIVAAVPAANKGATAGAKSGAYNLGATGSPVEITTTNALEVFTRMTAVLGEQNVRQRGDLVAVIPEWFRHLLLNSDLRKALEMADDESAIRSGKLGRLDTVDIFCSNKLAMVDDGGSLCTRIWGGHRKAVVSATQLVHNEYLKTERDFGVIYRGLKVYGYKALQPEATVELYAKKG